MAETPNPREQVPEINLTSMIDVIFLLIIFFMFVSELASLETYAPVNLPEASQAKPNPAPPAERIVVNVLAGGSLIVMGKALDMDAFKRMLTTESALNRRLNDGKNTLSLLIRADAGAPSGILRRLLVMCLEPGIGISDISLHAVQAEGA